MSDNVSITAGAGTVVATDDVGGVQVQRVKVTFGVDGTATDANAATPLPVDTELPAAAAMADAVANPTVPNVAANNVIWSGTGWDRQRSAAGANGTTGTGVVAAGAMVHDGTNFRRAIGDTTGLPFVQVQPGLTGGWSAFSNGALTNAAVVVKGSAGTVGGYMIYNPAAAVTYVQVFNVAAASVVLGTTPPAYVIPVPAGAAVNMSITSGIGHATAISCAATTTPTGSTAPTTAAVASLLFK